MDNVQTLEQFDLVRSRCDVCVVGGGMAGLCAALASARRGAKTVLVQDRPVLGGNASSEVRMWVCGAHGDDMKETGLLEEVQLDNCYHNPAGAYAIWDSVLWAKATYQPNLTLLLNTTCYDVEAEGPADDRAIRMIRCWQLTSQTRYEIEARVFIDSSGDSVLAAGGAWFRAGREAREEFDEDIEPGVGDDKTMGNTLLIQLRKTDSPQPFTAPDWAYKFESPDDLPHRMRGVNGGNFWWIELGGMDDTIRDSETIRDELMRAAWGVWDYIKNRAPEKDDAENWALEFLGSLPGKRENRRLVGYHIMTQNDVRDGGRFDDTIAYGGWSMDDHHPAGLLYPGKPTVFHPAPSPYGIPYRCICSANVRNLMMAGRNISVTHAALSSTRVMATCAVIGQAAGTGAAMAVEAGVDPIGLYPDRTSDLQQALMEDDAFLPGLARRAGPLAAQTDFADAAIVRNGHDRPIQGASNAIELTPGRPLEWSWDSPRDVGGVRLVFDSNLRNDKRMPCSYPQKGDRASVPGTLVRSFRIAARDESGRWQTVHAESNNYQRLVRVPLAVRASAMRLVVESTWGADSARVFGCAPVESITPLPVAPRGMSWSDKVAETDPADLAPPENLGEGMKRAHGA